MGSEEGADVLRINRLRMSFGPRRTRGIISNGVGYFLLLYYSQVLGLEPALAGLAMMISMIVDAISDPLIGAGLTGSPISLVVVIRFFLPVYCLFLFSISCFGMCPSWIRLVCFSIC